MIQKRNRLWVADVRCEERVSKKEQAGHTSEGVNGMSEGMKE